MRTNLKTKLALLTLPLMILSYQNCSGGFGVADSSVDSQGLASENTPPVGDGASGGGEGTTPSTNEPIAGAESAVALKFPNPTIHNVSVEWAPEVRTDAAAKLQFRKAGTTTWLEAMPMRIIKAGSTSNAAAPSNTCGTGKFCWSERYSGSILDLDAGTSYEVRAYVTNASGVATYFKTGTVKTRSIPVAMSGGPVTNVSTTAELNAALTAATAGRIIQLNPGTYTGFTAVRSGAAGQPIVIRGASGVVLNGNVFLQNVSHVILERVTVNGTIRVDGANNVGVMNNTVNSGANLGIGSRGGSREFDNYIADNVVTGAAEWVAANMAVSGGVLYEGIELTGPGHVITNNRVSGYRDCISFFEAEDAIDQWSLDVTGNDLSICVDDAIEADSCFGNCRIIRNRVTNTFMGLSSQPSLGGHNYFVRNVLFNVLAEPFKLHNGTKGDIILNNTVVKNGDAFAIYDSDVTVSDTFIRNNLMIGSKDCVAVTNRAGETYGSCSGTTSNILGFRTFDAATSTVDYQGYGLIGSTAFTGRLGANTFSSLATLMAGFGGNESHAVQANLGVFMMTPTMPSTTLVVESPRDLRIGATASVVGKAVRIPGINAAAAQPAQGAFEAGAAAPVYGPRP